MSLKSTEIRFKITEEQRLQLHYLSCKLGLSKHTIVKISLLSFMNQPEFENFMEEVRKNLERRKKRQENVGKVE
jgi:hypothetical protein